MNSAKNIILGSAVIFAVVFNVAHSVTEDEPTFIPASENTVSESSTVPHLSVKKMTQLLVEFSATTSPLEDLLQKLQDMEQKPRVLRDQNSDTGEMIIVRTERPLAGTRYFHAQYFTDEAQRTFVQHMSFEMDASPEAMREAIKAVRDAFAIGDTPSEERPDFIQWRLDRGYVVWIKRLGEDDIQGNPFNPYSHKDLGSLRIAVELAPEGH